MSPLETIAVENLPEPQLKAKTLDASHVERDRATRLHTGRTESPRAGLDNDELEKMDSSVFSIGQNAVITSLTDATAKKALETLPDEPAHNDQFAADSLMASQPATEDPTKDAERTPVPGSNTRPSSNPHDESARMGGGGDDGNDGPPESDKKPELLPVSEDIKGAVEELSNRGLKIEIVELENDFERKGETRRDILSKTRRFGLRAIQKEGSKLKALVERAEDLKYTSKLSEELYDLEAGEYRSYGEELGNYKRKLNLPEVLDLLYHRDENGLFIPRKWVDVGGGNCNILRLLQVELEKIRHLMANASQARASGKKRTVGNTWARSFEEAAVEIVKNGKSDLSDVLTALDISSQSMAKMRRKGINGMPVDVCMGPEEFLQAIMYSANDNNHTKRASEPPSSPSGEAHNTPSERAAKKKTPQPYALLPNQSDVVHTSMTADRVSDLRQFFENIKLLGKLDENDPTILLVDTLMPLSHVSDNETHSPNVPKLHFWNPDAQGGDPRKSMMGDRQEAIVNFVWYLNSIGCPVDRIAEYPSHEVVNLHCIVEDAATIRSEYSELEKKEFVDPELTMLVQRIFAPEDDPERIPDDMVLCIPQEYTKVSFICRIKRPIDAAQYFEAT